MFSDYIKILNERKNINKKVDKGYKKLIISIIVMTLGFALPGFLVSEIPLLMNLTKAIDALYMAISKTNEVITPLIYLGTCLVGAIGTIANTIKILIQKHKLRNIEYEEKEKILEIKAKIEELNNENQLVKEQVVELNKGKKQVLKDLKEDIKEEIEVVEIKNNEKKVDAGENIKEVKEIKKVMEKSNRSKTK